MQVDSLCPSLTPTPAIEERNPVEILLSLVCIKLE